MIKPPPSVSFIGTFCITLLAITGLFTVDTFLAKVDRTENDVEAVRLFKEGQESLARGETVQAISRIVDAIEIDRTNRYYQRTLAQAQFAAGRITDAKATLAKLLESDSADGQSSLLMAHILRSEGRYSEAVSYFHRAIYARWSEDETGNRRRARSELIDLLAQQNSKEELLAELLAVQEQAPQDLKARNRMGELFLQAGSPARASDVFRGILHDQPSDADAYKGLGEAEFSKGNYHAAERDFQTALRLAPSDADIQQRLDICTQVLELDPMLRGLSAEERFRRSASVLEMTLNKLNECTANQEELAEKASDLLKAHVNAAQRSETSEENLDLAEQLWQARKKECRAQPDQNSPLALVLARLTQ